MHSDCSIVTYPRNISCKRRLAAPLLLLALMAPQTPAADIYYTGIDTSWFDPLSWTPQSVPTTGDAIFVHSVIPATENHLFVGSYSSPPLNSSITVDALAGGTMTLALTDPFSSLNNISTLTLGSQGHGRILQSGTLSTLSTTTLFLGHTSNPDAFGQYDLTGGSLTVSANTLIDHGTFNATSGHATFNDIYLGTQPGATAILNLSGTTLTASSLNVGFNDQHAPAGTGILNISSSFAPRIIQSLVVSTTSTYTQTGGDLSIGLLADFSAAGTFNFIDGRMTIYGLLRPPQRPYSGNGISSPSALVLSSPAPSASVPVFVFASGGNIDTHGNDTTLIAADGGTARAYLQDSTLSPTNSTPQDTLIIGAGGTANATAFIPSQGSFYCFSGSITFPRVIIGQVGSGLLDLYSASTLTADDVVVGDSSHLHNGVVTRGNGSLTISSGSVTANDSLIIGRDGGIGSVSVSETTAEQMTLHTITLVIGTGRTSTSPTLPSSASLGIGDFSGSGATATCDTLSIALDGGSGGLRINNDNSSLFVANDLFLGTSSTAFSDSSATITLAGGLLQVGGTLYTPAPGHLNSATIKLGGGTLRVHNLLLDGIGPFGLTEGGVIELTGGQLTRSGTLTLPPYMTLAGTGTVLPSVLASGTITPGSPVGTLNFASNLARQFANTLQFDIAGTAPDQHDHINVAGSITLGGTVTLTTLPSFTPHFGDSFDLLDAAAFVNQGITFDTWFAPLPPEFLWDTSAFATTGIISISAHPGDATLDGTINAFDLNLLAANWQQPSDATWLTGDFTHDGKVDAFDLNVLAANWQYTAPPAPAAAFPTPEPTTLLLLSPLLTLLARRRFPSQI